MFSSTQLILLWPHSRETAYETILSFGLGCEVFILVGDNHRAVELAKAFVTLADIYARIGRYDDALIKYNDVDNVQEKILGDRLWTRKQLGLLNCKLKMGDARAVLNLKSDTLKVDDCTPGIHMPFALAHRQLAESGSADDREKHLRAGMHVATVAYHREAPWDDVNKKANMSAAHDLYTELKQERHRKRREKMFVEKWGRLIIRIRSEVDKDRRDRVVSWASLKAKHFDMFQQDEDPTLEAERAAAEVRDLSVQASIQATAVEGEEVDGGVKDAAGDLDDDAEDIIVNKEGKKIRLEEAPVEFHRFKMTKEVRKWWESQKSHPKYKVRYMCSTRNERPRHLFLRKFSMDLSSQSTFVFLPPCFRRNSLCGV